MSEPILSLVPYSNGPELKESSMTIVHNDNSLPIYEDQVVELYINEIVDGSKEGLCKYETSFLELEAMQSSNWLPSLIICHNIENKVDDLLQQVYPSITTKC